MLFKRLLTDTSWFVEAAGGHKQTGLGSPQEDCIRRCDSHLGKYPAIQWQLIVTGEFAPRGRSVNEISGSYHTGSRKASLKPESLNV